MKHHIEKMIIDLYLNKQENAYELQQKVSQLFHKNLEKITDKVLSEYSDKHTTIYIAALEIDLGNIRESHFELDFVKQYETELRKAIRTAVSKIETNPTYRREKQETTQNTNPKNAELYHLQDFNSQSIDENIIEILFFFLSFGRLPANASRDFNVNTALQYALNHQKYLAIERFKPLLKQQEIIHRLIYSFSETTANLFLSVLLPNRFQAISTAIENATSVFNTSQFGTNRQKIHKKLLLISFELIRQNFIQKNTIEIDLAALNTSFLNILPEQWKTVQTPIYETAFMAQKTQKINIKKLIELPYEALVKTLQKAANRQFIIENSSANQRQILLKILGQNHLQTIQKIVDSFIDNASKTGEKESLNDLKSEEKSKQRTKTNQEKINNIVWSTIFEQFSKYETPDKIQIKQLEQAIQNSLKQESKNKSENKSESESEKTVEQKAIYLVKRAEDILEIYLTEGYFIQNIGLNDLIEKMLNTDAVQLRFLLNRIAKTQAAQNRLTENLSLENLEKVLKILVPNTKFIQTIQGLISETQQIILLKNVIQQQLKYGKIDVILTLDEFFQSILLENLPPNFLDDLIQQSTTETTQIFIADYFAAESVINPIGESEVPELFEATRFLDYFHQYFNQNTIQNKGEIWWTKTISINDLNQNFQSIISIYPNEIKNIFSAFSKQKNISTALINLLNENNLTVLMNLIEPNIFGFISTMILTSEKYTSINKAWEITLKAYFNTSKPFNTNTFTQQVLLLLAQELKQSYQETIKEILVYSETQIKNNQHRYHALKHIIQQDIRMKNTPKLVMKSIENQNTNIENLSTQNGDNEGFRLTQKNDDNINSNQNTNEENLLSERIDSENNSNSNNLEEKEIKESAKINKNEAPLPIEIISYFLKYGTLPIGQSDLTEADLIEIIKKQSLENLNLLKITIQKLLKNTVSNRQLKQISQPILIELIKVLQPKISLSVLDIYTDFKMVVDIGILKTSMLELVANVRIFNQKSIFEKHYIHNVLTNLADNFSYTYQTALIAILTEFEDKNPKSKVVKQLRLVSVRLAEQEKNDTIENKPVPVVERTITPLKDTAIYIENSGIVILSVFLPHLFNMFNLIENKKFKDMEAACRAAYMIHFIATGRTEPMEHELVLSKIICNIPLGQPINAVISLTEEELEGCKQLMKAAIGRWEKVKSSSIEGFRNSFIAREGKLLKTSKGWSLAVEQKPFDLLLKTLPWGMTMVRFSWMDEGIYVDWAY
jgi:hypothetical protein